MKKTLAFLLLFVYAVVSTGFVVSVHYCMDRLNGVALGDTSRDTCGECGMPLKEAGGCCKDNVKVYKLQIDQAFAKISKADFSLVGIAPAPMQIFPFAFVAQSAKATPVAHGPPLGAQDTYLKNRVFRI